jgi:hypothetical protein
VWEIIPGDIENHRRHPFQATADIVVLEVEHCDWTPEVIQRSDGIEVETACGRSAGRGIRKEDMPREKFKSCLP